MQSDVVYYYSEKMKFSRYLGVLSRNICWQKPSGFRWFSAEGPSSSPLYDVIIVGGGMVGSTLACALGEYRY